VLRNKIYHDGVTTPISIQLKDRAVLVAPAKERRSVQRAVGPLNQLSLWAAAVSASNKSEIMQDPIAAAVVLYSEERASLVSSAFVGGTVKRSVAADSDTGVWALSL